MIGYLSLGGIRRLPERAFAKLNGAGQIPRGRMLALFGSLLGPSCEREHQTEGRRGCLFLS